MYNPTHFKKLKPTTRKMPKWIGFDIETYGKDNKFYCAVLSDYKTGASMLCYSAQEVKEALRYRKLENHKYRVVATNLMFDFLGTFGFKDEEVDFIEKDGIFYGASYYLYPKYKDKKRHQIKFYDTMRFFPKSVEQIGKCINLPKLKAPSWLGQRKPQTDKENEELIKYCERDATISSKFMYMFTEYCEKRGIQPKITIGSTAMADFKTNYLEKDIPLEPDKHREIAFKGYCGGRTEVFRRGTFKKTTCYDFNSVYPSVMRDKLFPNPESGVYTKKMKREYIENYEGVVKATVHQPEIFIPILPYKEVDQYGSRKKLLFPCGTFTNYFTFVELREALKHTNLKIKKLYEGVYYTKSEDYFSQFMNDKYNERLKYKKEKNQLEEMSKLFMNNLYGKFGENYREASKIMHGNQLCPYLDSATEINPTNSKGYFRVVHKGNPKEHSFPIWSAYITAYARIKLWHELNKYQDSVLYCDTDSIFIDSHKKVKTSQALGRLSKEYDSYFFIAVRPKVYASEKHIKMKGVNKKLSLEQFKRILKGESITEQKFTKLRTALSSQEHHKNGKKKINQIIVNTKKINPEDTKRQWQKPFSLDEEQTSKALKV